MKRRKSNYGVLDEYMGYDMITRPAGLAYEYSIQRFGVHGRRWEYLRGANSYNTDPIRGCALLHESEKTWCTH